jgi:dTDP-4-dehydrorhamnose reductase
VIPVPSAEYPVPARRPLNSRLSGEKLRSSGIVPMPAVRDALTRYLKELAEEQAE